LSRWCVECRGREDVLKKSVAGNGKFVVCFLDVLRNFLEIKVKFIYKFQID